MRMSHVWLFYLSLDYLKVGRHAAELGKKCVSLFMLN